MKKTLLILISIIFFFSCKNKEQENLIEKISINNQDTENQIVQIDEYLQSCIDNTDSTILSKQLDTIQKLHIFTNKIIKEISSIEFIFSNKENKVKFFDKDYTKKYFIDTKLADDLFIKSEKYYSFVEANTDKSFNVEELFESNYPMFAENSKTAFVKNFDDTEPIYIINYIYNIKLNIKLIEQEVILKLIDN